MSVRSVLWSLSAIFALSCGSFLEKASAHGGSGSLVGEVDLVVESVEIVEGQATANVVLSFELLGQPLEQELSVPIEIGAIPGDEVTPDRLTLSLEPVDLDLAGLTVEVDDGEGGPIVVEIEPTSDVDDPSALIGEVAGALADGVDFETILAGLSEEDALLLTTTLAGVLDEAFVALIEDATGDDDDGDCDVSASKSHGGNGSGKGKGQGRGKGKGKGRGGDDDDEDEDDDDSNGGSRSVELVELESDGVAFETEEGLLVETSAVRLEISAEGGTGNLLGNMIRQLQHLQSRPGKTGKAQQAILKNIRRALERLQIPAL